MQVYRESSGQQIPWTASSLIEDSAIIRASAQPVVGPQSGNRGVASVLNVPPALLNQPNAAVTRPLPVPASPQTLELAKPEITPQPEPKPNTLSTYHSEASTTHSRFYANGKNVGGQPGGATAVRVLNRGDDSIPTAATLAAEQIRRGAWESAEDTLNQIIKSDTANSDATMMLGEVRVGQSRYREALEQFNSAIQLSPLNPLPLLLRGITYSLLGQYELAVHDCEIGLAVRPDDMRFVVEMANLLFVVGHLREAIALCNKAIASDSSDAIAYIIRGNCERSMGNPDAATSDYTKAASLQSR